MSDRQTRLFFVRAQIGNDSFHDRVKHCAGLNPYTTEFEKMFLNFLDLDLIPLANQLTKCSENTPKRFKKELEFMRQSLKFQLIKNQIFNETKFQDIRNQILFEDKRPIDEIITESVEQFCTEVVNFQPN